MFKLSYYGIDFFTRNDAKEFLYRMSKIAENYGDITLANVLEMFDIVSHYYDSMRYWTDEDVNNAIVVRVKRRYTIELPNLKHRDTNKPYVEPPVADKPSVDSTPEPLNICVHINDLDDTDSVLADTFKYIYTIKDRMVNLTIM